jgi:hypothetical protein
MECNYANDSRLLHEWLIGIGRAAIAEEEEDSLNIDNYYTHDKLIWLIDLA